MDIQSTFIIGRLVRDPELKYLAGGTAVMEFSIATNHKQGKNGNEDVSYFNAKAFGKLAENLKAYMAKGKQIAIRGFLKQERWVAQNGAKKDRVVINCDEIQLLGGNPNGGNGGSNFGNANAYDENGNFNF